MSFFSNIIAALLNNLFGNLTLFFEYSKTLFLITTLFSKHHALLSQNLTFVSLKRVESSRAVMLSQLAAGACRAEPLRGSVE